MDQNNIWLKWPNNEDLGVCLLNGKPLEYLKERLLQDIHLSNARDTLLIDPHIQT